MENGLLIMVLEQTVKDEKSNGRKKTRGGRLKMKKDGFDERI